MLIRLDESRDDDAIYLQKNDLGENGLYIAQRFGKSKVVSTLMS